MVALVMTSNVMMFCPLLDNRILSRLGMVRNMVLQYWFDKCSFRYAYRKF